MTISKRLLDQAYWRSSGTSGTSVVVNAYDRDNDSHIPKQIIRRGPSDNTHSDTRPIDPYWWWHDATGYRVFVPTGDSAPPHAYSFIAEGNLIDFVKWADGLHWIKVPPAYVVNAIRTKETKARALNFFTLSIDVPLRHSSLFTQTEGDVNEDELSRRMNLLATCKHLKRLQLGFERGEPKPDSRQNDNDPSVRRESEIDSALRQNGAKSPKCSHPSVVTPQVADVVIGVIDDGAAFAHETVRREDTGLDAGPKTRVSVVWNQTHQVSHHNLSLWSAPSDGWYGLILGGDELNNVMRLKQLSSPLCGDGVSAANGSSGESDSETRSGTTLRDEIDLDELGCYATLVSSKGARRAIRSRESHGAAVLAAIAGSRDARSVIPSGADEIGEKHPNRIADAASVAPIILVDLPDEQKEYSSGRWMPMCALDGVRFIVDRARAMYVSKNGEAVPVVINISSGASAGAHDGTSIIESALSELLASEPYVAVTVAAGNSRLSQAHAEKTIDRGATDSFYVRVPPGKVTETYTELWPEWIDDDGRRLPWQPDYIQLKIIAPDGRSVDLSSSSPEAVFSDKLGRVVAGVIFSKNVVQSIERPMILVAVAATLPHEYLVSAPYGNWKIYVTNLSEAKLRISGWIERDEVVFGHRQPQLAHFVEDATSPAQVHDWDDETRQAVSRRRTSSNLANASRVIAVAAGVGGRADGYVAPYSGAGGGSQGEGRPQMIARADRSPAQPGMPSWGAFRSARRHMNGTSIAAPIAARWIANAFARGCDRDAVLVLAQHSEPRIHPHLGVTADSEGKFFVDMSDMSACECYGVPYSWDPPDSN